MYTDSEWQKIHYADQVLKSYWKAREAENQAKQSGLSGVNYDGMPANPSPGNTIENEMVAKTDQALKASQYHKAITDTLNDIIKPQSGLWYRLLHMHYISKEAPSDIQLKLQVSHTYYNKYLNQALLHFSNSIDLQVE